MTLSDFNCCTNQNRLQSGRERKILYDITYMKSKRIIQVNLFTKQKQTTDIENKLMVTQRERGGGGINQEYGINRYTPLYIKQIKQQGFTVQHMELYSVSCDNL